MYKSMAIGTFLDGELLSAGNCVSLEKKAVATAFESRGWKFILARLISRRVTEQSFADWPTYTYSTLPNSQNSEKLL